MPSRISTRYFATATDAALARCQSSRASPQLLTRAFNAVGGRAGSTPPMRWISAASR